MRVYEVSIGEVYEKSNLKNVTRVLSIFVLNKVISPKM